MNVVYENYFGSLTSVPTTPADVRNLLESVDNSVNNFILNTGTTGNNFILVLPKGKTLVSVIDNSAAFVDITNNFVASNFPMEDDLGTPYDATIFVCVVLVPYFSNHIFNITIR
jgi:hypothetical protein